MRRIKCWVPTLVNEEQRATTSNKMIATIFVSFLKILSSQLVMPYTCGVYLKPACFEHSVTQKICTAAMVHADVVDSRGSSSSQPHTILYSLSCGLRVGGKGGHLNFLILHIARVGRWRGGSVFNKFQRG